MSMNARVNCMLEWPYESARLYEDPVREVTLDAQLHGPAGEKLCVPGFWAGDGAWRIRLALPAQGLWRFRTVCSDARNPDLHGREGEIHVLPYEGSNPLLARGRPRVSASRRSLEHRDGTPFFWLGDTWWMGLTSRLGYPEELDELAADRVRKGFSVVQLVAGLYPDMGWRDPRGANEAGFPWDEKFTRINPAWFDMADLRIGSLVRRGLTPCIVGSWGYFLDFAGMEALKRHWRYLVARWSAWPVVWCAAGEALMDYYLAGSSPRPEERAQWQRRSWSELIRYVRAIDPYGSLVTIHASQAGYVPVEDPAALDLAWLSVGHDGYPTLADAADMLERTLGQGWNVPVIPCEVNYEGILESSREEVQRFLFWSSMLAGAAGYTYGANGIWQVNRREAPYGPSPHGMSWGDTPWDEAARLPGSTQVGLGRRLLERYPWWDFVPHPEWVDPHQEKGNRYSCYAAGIPGRVRVVFFPHTVSGTLPRRALVLRELERGLRYRGMYVNPKTGREHPFGAVEGDATGSCPMPKPPSFQDWVLVVERE